MITLQHSLVYLSALAKEGKVDLEKFKEDVPWVLLPDAIRCYTGAREYTHFEESSTIGGDISWIEFPEDLKSVSKENLPPMYLADGIKKAVIGEATHVETFHEHNGNHSKYVPIRAHLEQDVILDDMLRELVDCTEKYEDDFTVNPTGEKIDGQELRRRVAAFEKYGFLRFAKNVYEKTGILVNQKWFDENVKTALEQTYSQDMADSTYKYMKIDPEIEKRIANQEFDLTDEDIAEVGFGDNLAEVLEQMYQDAVEKTIEVEDLVKEETDLDSKDSNEMLEMNRKGLKQVLNGDYDLLGNSRTWEENKKFLTENYPLTPKWFEEKERPKTTEELEQEVAELRDENERLKEAQKHFQTQNAELDNQVRKLQSMLSTTLEFCTKVRQSTVGKIFFGKDAKKLPEASEKTSDKDER